MLSDKIILAISHLFSFCPFCFPGPNCWAYLSGGVPGVQMGAGISVQLPGGSNRREQFVWRSPGADGSRMAVPGPRSCTCARGRQNQFLQTNIYRHNANFEKNCLSLEQQLSLLAGQLGSTSVDAFIGLRENKMQLPDVLSCSTDSSGLKVWLRSCLVSSVGVNSSGWIFGPCVSPSTI